jgi:hypothetical protein
MIGLLSENNFGDTRSGSLAGPTGLVIILLLAVATIFLIRSMNTHLRRVPARFEQTHDPIEHPVSDVEDVK